MVSSPYLRWALQQRSEKNKNIAKAMDEIRDKFGKSSIKFAHVIGNDIGIDED